MTTESFIPQTMNEIHLRHSYVPTVLLYIQLFQSDLACAFLATVFEAKLLNHILRYLHFIMEYMDYRLRFGERFYRLHFIRIVSFKTTENIVHTNETWCYSTVCARIGNKFLVRNIATVGYIIHYKRVCTFFSSIFKLISSNFFFLRSQIKYANTTEEKVDGRSVFRFIESLYHSYL